MDSFLFSVIPRIVGLPAEKVPWHYNSICQQCNWQNSCRQRTEQEGTVSMIPDLSIDDAGFLREVIKLRADGNMTDIEEMDSLVKGGLRIVEQSYPSTATRFRSLMGMKRGEIGSSPVIEAVTSKKPQAHPTSILLILAPRKTHFPLPQKRRLCRSNFIGSGSIIHVIPAYPRRIRYQRVLSWTT